MLNNTRLAQYIVLDPTKCKSFSSIFNQKHKKQSNLFYVVEQLGHGLPSFHLGAFHRLQFDDDGVNFAHNRADTVLHSVNTARQPVVNRIY